MKTIHSVLLGVLFIGGSIPQTILSDTILVENSSGESFELGIDANDRFLDVLNQIHGYLQEDEVLNTTRGVSLRDSQWSLVVSQAGITAKSKQQEKQWRNYDLPVSKEEKEDISYIVKTLAYDSLISIGTKKSSLKKAGKRIDHIHPLRFLMTVFSNEELKVGIAAIRTQTSWVKDGFFDGLTESLAEEGARNNLFSFIDDFAKTVKIDKELILPVLKRGQWKDFINVLIDNIPRQTDPNRYNI